MSSYRATLPWAPSVNSYWRSIVVGGKVRTLLSRKGRKYRAEAGKALMLQKLSNLRLRHRVRVEIQLCGPTKARRDIDNFPKGVLDAITHAGVWLDDSQVDELLIRRGPIVQCGCVNVWIYVL